MTAVAVHEEEQERQELERQQLGREKQAEPLLVFTPGPYSTARTETCVLARTERSHCLHHLGAFPYSEGKFLIHTPEGCILTKSYPKLHFHNP